MKDQANESEPKEAESPEPSVPGILLNVVTGKPKKKRKELKDNAPPPDDNGSYVVNASGRYARLFVEGEVRYKVPLYHVYHLIDRQLNGNDDGSPRHDITDDIVMPIVLECVNAFLLYSSILQISWLNYNRNGDVILVVCQKEVNGELITIPIEAHLVENNMIEITVRTAFPLDVERGIGDNQLAVELWQDGSSTLKRYDRKKKKFNDLCNLPLDK